MAQIKCYCFQVAQGCPKLQCLDVGFCYKTIKDGTNFIAMDVFPATLTELSLHGVQLRDDQIVDLVPRLPVIRALRLCGIMSVDDRVIESVSSCIQSTLALWTPQYYQKLITYLKCLATIHFFASMLRNIHFYRRNIFLE